MIVQEQIVRPETQSKLRIDGITHRFADASGGVLAISDITLDVRPNSFVSLIGQSGCGKSTLFNILAGLLQPSAGRVLHDGRDVTGRAGLVSYMLQKDLLLPWRTVLDNVVFGLEIQGADRGAARDLARPLLARYGLGSFETHYPASLSGGMRQRAALLRTLLCGRDVMLLDEPFAALDAQTRFRMQQWLLTLWKDFARTILFVTHDVDEAIFLSDEIVVLSPRPGRIREHIAVPLPRPRPRAILTSPEFAHLKQRCLALLFEGASGPDDEEGEAAAIVPSSPPARAQPTILPSRGLAAQLKLRDRASGVVLRRERRWSRSSVWLLQAALLVAIIGGWEGGVRLHLIDAFFWSSPSDIANTAVIFFSQGAALQDTWFTFRATIVGFVLGSLLGAIIGVSLWWSANWAVIIEPYIVVFNSIPKMALGPLIILVFGIGIASKIALAVALTFVITAIAAYAGVKSVDDDLVKLTLSLGGRRRDVFFKIILPSTLPWIISSLRINIGMALAGVIVGEFLSSQYGLGKEIMYAGSTYDMGLIWVGIIILSALSIVLYAAVVWFERLLLKGVLPTASKRDGNRRRSATAEPGAEPSYDGANAPAAVQPPER
jgi:NitT/TauT family transport system permease protein